MNNKTILFGLISGALLFQAAQKLSYLISSLFHPAADDIQFLGILAPAILSFLFMSILGVLFLKQSKSKIVHWILIIFFTLKSLISAGLATSPLFIDGEAFLNATTTTNGITDLLVSIGLIYCTLKIGRELNIKSNKSVLTTPEASPPTS